MSDTWRAPDPDFNDGHFEELPDEVHSPHWVPDKPPPGLPDSGTWTPPPGAPSPLNQLAKSQPDIWQRGGGRADQPTTVANLGPQTRPPQPQTPTVKPQPQPWTQPRAAPQPQRPDTPLLSPTGLPPPVRQFSPYLPAMPTRSHDAWGTTSPFAPEPRSFEVPSINQGVGSWFGQNGSGITALLGLGGANFANAFAKSYMQGMTWKSNFQREQMQQHMEALAIQQKEETDAYAEVVNTYAANDYKDVGGVSYQQAMEQVAQRYNDTNMINTLATSGPGGAYKLLQNRDAKWQDVQASNKVANKDAQDAKDLSDWDVPGASATDAQGAPGASTTPPSLASTAARAPGMPSPPPDPNAPSPQAQPVASQPETQTDRVDALPRYQQEGIELLRGGNLSGVPKAVQPHVKQFADDTLGKMDALVAKAQGGKMTKDQIEQELRKINPAIAGEFAGIRDLDAPLPGGMSAINAHPFWRDIASLASASVPGWRANDYAVVGEMQRDYTTGTSSRRMQAANNMADAAVPLLKALKNIPEGTSPPENWIEQIAAKRFTGDPRWVTLFNTLQQYVQESQSLASPTGRYFEGDVNRMMHEFDIAQGPRAMRSIIGADADAATRRIGTLTDDYQNTVHKPFPPHYNPKATEILKALATIDPDKGFGDRSDLPPDLQGLGMGQSDPAASRAAPAAPTGPTPGWGGYKVQ
jgi:hypothetical protein